MPPNHLQTANPPQSTTKSKLKPPVYPRPVSPVPIVECPVTSSQQVYLELDNGFEGESAARASKRRRIEDAAKTVLRGERVFIMTAGLKGPFDEGWKNPWAKKRQLQIPETTAGRRRYEVTTKVVKEVPETYGRAALRSMQEVAGTHEKNGPESAVQTAKRRYPNEQENPFCLGTDNIKLKELDDVNLNDLPDIHARPVPEVRHTKQIKVEDWLKVNKDLKDPDPCPQHSSPTPSVKHIDQGGDAALPRPDSEQPLEPSIELVDPGSSRRPSYSARSRLRGYRRLLEQASLQGSPPRQPSVHSEPVQPPVSNVQQLNYERRKSHDDGDQVSNNVPEPKKWITKKMATYIEPASTQLSPFEYKRLSSERNLSIGDENIKPRAELSRASNTSQDHKSEQELAPEVQSAPQLAEETSNVKRGTEVDHQQSGDTSHTEPYTTAPPSLISEPSKGGATTNLPSAQHPSGQVPPPSSSNLLNGDFLLPEAQPVVPRAGDETARHDGSPANSDGQVEATSTKPAQCHEKDMVQFVEKCLNAGPQKKSTTNAIEEEVNTQQMLAEFSPIVVSTIKKLTTAAPRTETLATATKIKPTSQSKRTSFAKDSPSGSSQGSIKTSLKVSKAASSPIARPVSPCADKPSPLRLRPPTAVKGILKPTTSPPKSSIAGRDSNSTMQQEGQQGLLPALFENYGTKESQEFDLDGAISDLGSFLVAFDPEKEASRLASAGS